MILKAGQVPVTCSIRELPYTPFFGGSPLYWRDEQSGKLPAAVEAYMDHVCGLGPEPGAEQLGLVCDYLVYHIHAPCWENNLSRDEECSDMLAMLHELRERSKTLASIESIKRFTDEAMELGLAVL